MEAWSLAWWVVAFLFALLVLGIWSKRVAHSRSVQLSRQRGLMRASDRTLFNRLWGRSESSSDRQDGRVGEASVNLAEEPYVGQSDWLQGGYPDSTKPMARLDQQREDELTTLRTQVQERDESVRQLQRNLEQIVSNAGIDINDIEGSVPVQSSPSSEVARLQASLQELEQEVQRNHHALEEVDKLRKQLFMRGREMEVLQREHEATQDSLSKFRAGAQQAAKLEQQLSEAQAQISSLKAHQSGQEKAARDGSTSSDILSARDEGGRVSGQSSEVNKRKKSQLVDTLDQAEAEAEESQQNSLELRRLRSELESVRSDRSNAKNRISELEIRIREQQQALENARNDLPALDEVNQLKRTLAERQQQNEELQEKLSKVRSDVG